MQWQQRRFYISDSNRTDLWEWTKAAHSPFNTLKGTSPQLLKSNLGSELSGVNGLALAFDVDKRKGEMSLNLRIKSTDLMWEQVGKRLAL